MAAAVFGREGRQRIVGPCVFEDRGVDGVTIVRESFRRIKTPRKRSQHGNK